MRRYKHNLSHFRNTTCDMGQLTPIACLEVVRGDTFKHNSSAFLRVSLARAKLAFTLSPSLDNLATLQPPQQHPQKNASTLPKSVKVLIAL